MSDTLQLDSRCCSVAPARWSCFVELTKPGISALVLVATGLSFALAYGSTAGVGARSGAALGAPGLLDGLILAFHTLFGTALVAASANALNQLIEVPFDRKMVRTRNRPLPSGRLTPREVLVFSVVAALVGLIWLSVLVNGLCAALVATSWAVYVFVYTPFKRVTSLSVFVGAVPGALPPLIGWSGAAGHLSPEAWMLFAMMFFWQLPHFQAIAWLYREDYARAGYPVLPVVDVSGVRTSLHVVTHSVGLLAASLLPVLYGRAGAVHAAGAIVLGLGFLGFGILFVLRMQERRARWLLLASLVYLPALLVIMVIDRLAGAFST